MAKDTFSMVVRGGEYIASNGLDFDGVVVFSEIPRAKAIAVFFDMKDILEEQCLNNEKGWKVVFFREGHMCEMKANRRLHIMKVSSHERSWRKYIFETLGLTLTNEWDSVVMIGRSGFVTTTTSYLWKVINV